MPKTRVYELAKKMGIPSVKLLEDLKAMGVEVASNFSVLDESVVAKLTGAKKPSAPMSTMSKGVLHKPPGKKEEPHPATKEQAPQPTPFSIVKTRATVVLVSHGGVIKQPPPPAARVKKEAKPAEPAVKVVKAPKAQVPAPAVPTAAPPVPPKAPAAVPKAPAAAPDKAQPEVAAQAPLAQAPAAPKSPAETPAAPAAVEHAAPVPPVAKAPVIHPPSAPTAHEVAAPPEAAVTTQVQPSAPAAPAAPPKPQVPAQPRPQPVPQRPQVQPPPMPPRPPGPHPSAPSAGPHPGSGPAAYPQRPQAPRPPIQQPPRPPLPQGARPPASPIRPGVPPGRGPAPAHGRPPQPRPGEARRPSVPPGRVPVPQQAPSAVRPAEPPRPARPLAPPEARRKTKRERRMEKLQAKVDRRERLEQELEDARAKAETGEAIFIREGITVKELADKLNVKVKDIIAKLMMRGILVTINQPLDGQVAVQVSSMFNYAAEIISYEDELIMEQEEVPEEERHPRAPVVTVMGHVDHGKSSLLEAIHDVDITSKEHGGITQHIGAYRVTHNEREYVFLDTPGHEAFTLMRARGAQVTDIVILVVAADDGVMPQTVEAINHCKAANVPMVVAINKMDKPGADTDRVKKELSQHSILTEDWGGDVVSVPVSAKTRQGIDELLEMVALVAEMLHLEAGPDQPAAGTVLESKLDKARGPVATVLIQDGSLKVGDLFLCGSTTGHVRGMFDDKGERIDYAGPSTPVEILGFSEVPGVGAVFQGMTDEAKARQIASFRKEKEKAKSLRTGRVRLENVFGAIQQGEIQELPLILKADVHGSLEAVAQQVQDLSMSEVKINIVHQGVGAISESDVLLASASNALIIGFNVRPERKAIEIAKAEGVDIHLFTVIYDLIDRLKQALTGMLKPLEEEVVLGHADVKETFKVSKVGTVAGCIVADGRIPRTAQMRILRDNVVVFTGKISSLKRFKDDASEVKEGLECGIGIENFNDVKPGDVLEAFEIKITERTFEEGKEEKK